jgi:hypothetical protein
MIQFRVTSVARRASGAVPTIHYTYYPDKDRTKQQSQGAEWEEVEFIVLEEDKPTIQVANIAGAGFIIGQPCKLVINEPKLFGMYQVGDVIDFVPKRLADAEKTLVDGIVVPTLSP